jgi:response regulator RpfG family c-di-GMP phosphodiesterase
MSTKFSNPFWCDPPLAPGAGNKAATVLVTEPTLEPPGVAIRMPPNSRVPAAHPSLPDRNASARKFLQDLLGASLVLQADWDALPHAVQKEVAGLSDYSQVLARLTAAGLLTEYQAARIEAGAIFGLVLGNYRVLDRLGAGGMGIVYRGEHMEMRSQVAIKVFPLTPDQDPRLVSRFLVEMRAVAQLHHPNIVAAMDAGKAVAKDGTSAALRYFVMEYVPGKNLEDYVRDEGALVPAKACDLVHQIAGALAEVHKYNLIHRDIKPSNILVTNEDQAKLLDFGLARHFGHRMTEPGMALGTIDYISPEQARDASTVDIRADIYSLGGTLFWCLTGRIPFPPKGNIAEDLSRRITQPPPSVRELKPDVPAELDAVVARMMAINPDDRYSTPQVLMRTLLTFLKPESREHLVLSGDQAAAERASAAQTNGAAHPHLHRVLVVDDESSIRAFCRHVLQPEGLQCDEAVDGLAGWEAARDNTHDLLLVDVDLPVMSGLELVRRLRESPPCPHLKVIMISGQSTADEMARMLLAGADDYLTKPFSLLQLQGRVKAALRLKEAQDRSELLTRRLLAVNAELEGNLTNREGDLVHARNALVLALAKLVEHRDTETGAHLLRLQRYSRCLAEAAADSPTFADQIDQHFIEMLECCTPLHDIGKVALPDHILLKPGKLTPDERVLMQTHTIIGAETLKEVAKHHGSALAFLQMAIDITRHHHERFDGQGYPDRLAGSDIPLAARITAIADVYDAMRSRRVYKPALSHSATLQLMTEGSAGHFDPALLQVFQRCAPQFDKIFHELAD